MLIIIEFCPYKSGEACFILQLLSANTLLAQGLSCSQAAGSYYLRLLPLTVCSKKFFFKQIQISGYFRCSSKKKSHFILYLGVG